MEVMGLKVTVRCGRMPGRDVELEARLGLCEVWLRRSGEDSSTAAVAILGQLFTSCPMLVGV
jgi:hypothetical protein